MTINTADLSFVNKRVWIAGHQGVIGQSLLKRLRHEECELLTATHEALNLTDQFQLNRWIDKNRPDILFLLAAKVGNGVDIMRHPVDYLLNNLRIYCNTLEIAQQADIQRVVYCASAAIYPQHSPQPINEEALMTGQLEPSTQWYGLAKIMGAKLCEAYNKQYGFNYTAAVIANVYGPGDQFDKNKSRMIPALIHRAFEAKSTYKSHLDVWGSGKPKRELIYVDDCADALVKIAKSSKDDVINVGTGTEYTIKQIAQMICKQVQFDGKLEFLTDKPDGVMRSCLDSTKLKALGWKPTVDLKCGLEKTIQYFMENEKNLNCSKSRGSNK